LCSFFYLGFVKYKQKYDDIKKGGAFCASFFLFFAIIIIFSYNAVKKMNKNFNFCPMKSIQIIKYAVLSGLFILIFCFIFPHHSVLAQNSQEYPFGVNPELSFHKDITFSSQPELFPEKSNEWNTVFSLKPDLRYSFGESSYYLYNYSPVVNVPGEFTKYESKLIFPLDATLAGVSLEWTASPRAYTWWAFEASFLVNLLDPADKMRDNDWIDETQVYHTESDPELDLTTLDARFKYEFFRGVRTSMMFTGSLFYQRIQQDITGYEGWYFSPENTVSGTEPALHYEVDYFSPQVGVAALIRLGYSFAIELDLASGLVFTSDEDIHLLRGKRSTADATGYALSSGMKFRLMPSPAEGHHFSVDLLGSMEYFHAEGNQTQKWYLSEPGIPAGTVISGIPHVFESLQFNVGLRVGCTF